MSGAARASHKNFGAECGIGARLTGQYYAIPTMQEDVDTIIPYADEFIESGYEVFGYTNRMQHCWLQKGRNGTSFQKRRLSDLPQDFYNIIMASYMEYCFLYEKNAPEDFGMRVGHSYEPCWVNFPMQYQIPIDYQ